MTSGPDRTASIYALLPPVMAEKAERIGAERRLNTLSLLTLAVLAGAFIAFGAMFATAGASGALPYGVTRLLTGIVFSLPSPI